MPIKPKKNQPKTPTEVQEKDCFQTPSYATRLLLPYIPKTITHIWECAAGEGRISRILREAGYTVFETDIKESWDNIYHNFINDPDIYLDPGYAIITNPPFSIKDLFVEKCFEYGKPFALLIPMDYSQQMCDWLLRGCQKIVPTSRVAFITPHTLIKVREKEIWNLMTDDGTFTMGFTIKEVKEKMPEFWEQQLEIHKDLHNYSTIDEVPNELLYKYSNAQFHSGWLTWGFNLPNSEIIVDLSLESRRNDIK